VASSASGPICTCLDDFWSLAGRFMPPGHGGSHSILESQCFYTIIRGAYELGGADAQIPKGATPTFRAGVLRSRCSLR
jgi:hypothetical protein